MTDKNPSALNFRPSSAFTWVKQMVIAAADVKALFTGVEIKLTIKPNLRTKLIIKMNSEMNFIYILI